MLNESGGRGSREREQGAESCRPARPDSLNTAHLYEREEHDRACGPWDDRWEERNQQWFGWGEEWDN